jgi:glycine cleavage system H protein
MMNFPVDLKYKNTDEWVRTDGNIATVGVSDYAQNALSDVVFVEINLKIGDQVKVDDIGATIESVKAAADVNVPVSGKVIEVNESLPDKPETINSDPFGSAWLFKIEMQNPGELNSLMDAAAYEKYCSERGH